MCACGLGAKWFQGRSGRLARFGEQSVARQQDRVLAAGKRAPMAGPGSGASAKVPAWPPFAACPLQRCHLPGFTCEVPGIAQSVVACTPFPQRPHYGHQSIQHRIVHAVSHSLLRALPLLHEAGAKPGEVLSVTPTGATWPSARYLLLGRQAEGGGKVGAHPEPVTPTLDPPHRHVLARTQLSRPHCTAMQSKEQPPEHHLPLVPY